jgi:hypothetical protein
MKMQKQQYKRLYNIAFALLVICSFYFVFNFAKTFIKESFVEEQKVKLDLMYNQQSQIIYDKLVKAGKQKEADEFIHDPQENFFGTYLSEDENGKIFYNKYTAFENRIKFCEENLNVISVVGVLIAFALAYFLIWQILSFSARYVKGHSGDALTNSHINN